MTMRTRLFRILAVALLALAIPVQGLAALNSGLCMAAGGHGGEHNHAGSAHAHDHDQAPVEKHDSDTAHCPPCVSCCAAAAIAPTAKIALPEAPLVAAVAAPQYWISGVPPESLDRPPLAL